jgi:hypothetical protein
MTKLKPSNLLSAINVPDNWGMATLPHQNISFADIDNKFEEFFMKTF